MVLYEFEMVERFLENSIYLDIPTKYLLVAKCHCLAMFALKIVLKNVQKVDVSCDYIDNVIVKERGMQAMLLATRVAQDMFTGIKPDFLCTDEQVMENTNMKKVLFSQKNSFNIWKTKKSCLVAQKPLMTGTQEPQPCPSLKQGQYVIHI